jgi:peptidoglycan/LPS O-acetylase OafA/YrhL
MNDPAMTTGARHEHLSESLHRVSSIDALRGLAALSVVIYHARELLWVGLAATYHRYGLRPDFSALAGYLTAPFSYGGQGVTLFFVLSGYCIHRRGAAKLAADSETKLDCRNFALRRFWRIYPTYFCGLLLTALIDWWLASRFGVRPAGQDNSVLSFLVSLFALQDYLAMPFGSNGVFWTLAFEIHLYIAYPLLFFLSRKLGPWKTLLFTLAAGLAYLAANALFQIERHLPPHVVGHPVFLPFWFTWTAGFYLAEIEAGRIKNFSRHAWIGLVLAGLLGTPLAAAVGGEDLSQMFLALPFAALLLWSVRAQGRRFWSGWLGTGLAFVGVFSYSLYAIHEPVLKVLRALWNPSPDFRFQTIWPAIAAVPCVVFIAWVFFHAVEWWSVRKPGERIRYFRH